jgi:hypothetical protein
MYLAGPAAAGVGDSLLHRAWSSSKSRHQADDKRAAGGEHFCRLIASLPPPFGEG